MPLRFRYAGPDSTKPWYNKGGARDPLATLYLKPQAAATLLTITLCLPGLAAEMEQPPTPSPARQKEVLSAVRQYAERYVENLPNFICEQVTRQFEAGRKPKHWHKGDTLGSRLVYIDGREQRTLEFVNNRPIGSHPGFWRRPLVTEGEFGMLMERVFGSITDADFSWAGWQPIGDKWLAVFDYSIDKQHSTLSLTLGDTAKATVPYHGSIYADPSTGAIWRITSNPSDIPPQLQTRSIATTIDYAEIVIGGQSYLLPDQAAVALVTPSNHIRNEITFTNYRKFEAESRITYTPSSEGVTAPGKAASPNAPPN